ncbi:branched chain amino acid ABC transporter substrate-binding protein [Acrocarpospora pleiomorpha]|uniref:Branched chain amino acid ABC transporter substrate-binding protein n=1 Tax=Acrocarpospora pleiomorpha TaxID=90975 RepID=A0A5M3XHH1_9ACTN|nr:ABC transporter substrate-binding protein [Acrocarpospora pleiomorpha]GES17528.1 branched chain amino acid ABC transporter substrate-binding protein [Acrocarpospora pleiomorpha]
MKQPMRVVATAIAAGAVALAAACGSSGGTADDSSGESIAIGVVIDKTGAQAAYGVPGLSGIQLAVDQVNADGGIDGKQIDLIVEDGTSDPTVAAAAARTLSSKTSVVIGTSSSAGCRAMQPILDRAKVLHFCLSPTNIEPTPYFFLSMAPVTDYVPATLPWLEDLGVHRIGFIGQDDASGDGYLSIFSYIAKNDPGQYEVVAEQRFTSGSTNLETQMTKLRDANPDLIVAGVSGSNIVPIAQAAKALGMTQPIWVGTGSASLDALQPLANDLPQGGLFANAFWVNISDDVEDSVPYADKVKSFAKAYTDKYGEQPPAAAGAAYDNTEMIINALKGGATSGPEIAKAIEGSSYTGVLGPYEFSADKHQGVTLPPVMMQYTGASGFELGFSGS